MPDEKIPISHDLMLLIVWLLLPSQYVCYIIFIFVSVFNGFCYHMPYLPKLRRKSWEKNIFNTYVEMPGSEPETLHLQSIGFAAQFWSLSYSLPN